MGDAMQLRDRIGRRMKLQDLHVLMTVVQAGSMGKAAALLNTGQSAISRSIAELEHALGVRLLDRNRQGVEPTEYGRAFLDCGAAVFDDLRQGVKTIELLANPGTGEVRIGSSPYLAEHFVPAVIKQLSRRYPRIVFHLVTAEETDRLHRQLTERHIDLLIARRAFETRNLDSNFSTIPHSSSWRVPETRGFKNATSRSLSWRTNRGCCRRLKAYLGRLISKSSAPAVWTIPAQLSSPLLSACGSISRRPGACLPWRRSQY
jgi:DNA-binding transcriptional LysR family regulator